jgi:hypothetical protein
MVAEALAEAAAPVGPVYTRRVTGPGAPTPLGRLQPMG